MGIFNLLKPKVEKMRTKNDIKRLIKTLKYRRDDEIQKKAATANLGNE